jgi:spore germination protein YaaH
VRRVALLVVAVALLAAWVPAAATAVPRISCDRTAGLKFERTPGHTSGVLRWSKRPSAAAGTRYRVYRNGAVVGQTRRLSMRVRVRIGGTYTFAVRPVSKRGKVGRCGQRLRRKIAYVRPGRADAIGATSPGGAGSVRVSWERAARGDSRLVGYRVFRDGATFGQTKSTSIDVRVSSNRRYEVRVAAVDARGVLGPLSDTVTVETGHEAPPAPAGLVATEVDEGAITLSWSPSVPGRGRVVGYRVFRDGRIVRQVQGTSHRLTNLAASTSHSLTVVAVDSLGYLSAPSEPLAATTTRPVQTTGRLHAFLLASTDRSFADFRAHYRSIGTVHPTYFDCSKEAELTGRDDPLITRWSRERGVRVLPRFNCQRSEVLNRILREPELRERWLTAIVRRAEEHGYDGVNLDFEAGYPTDRDVYSAFVADLAQRLHDRGKTLSVAVSAKSRDVANHPRSTFYDYRALSDAADSLFVMAWGYKWTTSAPGAPDPVEWIQAIVAYIRTMPNYQRFVLGSPLYGMDWAADGGFAHPADHWEYDELLALTSRFGVTPWYDAPSQTMRFDYVDDAGQPHQVWYHDASTLAARVALAREAGLGSGVWRLGNEDQRIWEHPLIAP